MSKIVCLAYQVNKGDPSHPGNKIAFTMDGTLCFVTQPRAAHDIVGAAAREYEARVDSHRASRSPYKLPPFREDIALGLVGKHLAAARDLAEIAKRAT